MNRIKIYKGSCFKACISALILMLVTTPVAHAGDASLLSEYGVSSDADIAILLHQNLSLRLPNRRYLLIEHFPADEHGAELLSIKGQTFKSPKFGARAVNIRQLLHAGGHHAEVKAIVKLVEAFDWAAMDGEDIYGNPVSDGPFIDGIMCMDGSILTLEVITGDELMRVQRHVCAGRTSLDELLDNIQPHLVRIDKVFGKSFIPSQKPE